MIPVVIISISTERHVHPGAAAMLTKPLDRGELTQVLKRQFAASAGVDPALSPVLIVEDDADTRELMGSASSRSSNIGSARREGIDWLNANPDALGDPARLADAGDERVRVPSSCARTKPGLCRSS